MLEILRRYFEFGERKTSFATEVIAGTTTFLAMAYIIFVNPAILASAGMNKTALITVTCVVTALATLLTGFFARAPIAMAPGMGLNAFFAYSLVIGDKIRWETALGIVFMSGFFFLILTLLGIRKKLVEAIPSSLISAMSVGIGLFIAFIGLVNLGIVVKNAETLIAAGPVTSTVLIGFAGLLVMILCEMKNVKGSLILGIFVSTVLAVAFGKVTAPPAIFSFQFDLAPLFLKLDVWGALRFGFFGAIFTLMFMDMFDSIGSLVACCHQAKMVDQNGNIKGLDRLLVLDAAATMLGALFGTSTTTTYVESAAGIEQGGRTGFSAFVTAFWFLASLLLIPLVAIVPSYATAPALLLVGFFMIKEVRNIDFSNFEEGFPSFMIILMIALSYSISSGLAFGFISFALIKMIRLKFSEIKPVLWVIVLLSIIHFIV